MLFGARWGLAKWGIARWGFPVDKHGTNWSGSFEADGVATVNITKTIHKIASAKFTAAGTSPDSFHALIKMSGSVVAQGVCSVVWTSHQKFVAAFQVERREEHWKRYLNGLAVDGFGTDWDGGQRYWKDGLPTDFINSIPEVVFFQGFKGKEFKYYYNGLATDGLNQDGSQTYWMDGLAYDFLDTPITNNASIIINGQGALTAATRQAFAARFNIGGAATVQFATTQKHVGRPTMAGKASMSITKHNSAMFAKFVCNGLANVTFMSGIGSVNITCVDTGFVGGGGPPVPAISFLYDAPYSY